MIFLVIFITKEIPDDALIAAFDNISCLVLKSDDLSPLRLGFLEENVVIRYKLGQAHLVPVSAVVLRGSGSVTVVIMHRVVENTFIIWKIFNVLLQ